MLALSNWEFGFNNSSISARFNSVNYILGSLVCVMVATKLFSKNVVNYYWTVNAIITFVIGRKKQLDLQAPIINF